MNGKVARVKFDVLVSGNAFNSNVTRRDAQIQVAVLGQVNGDLNVVPWSASEVKFGGTVQDGEPVLYVFDFVSVLAGRVLRPGTIPGQGHPGAVYLVGDDPEFGAL